MARDDNDWLDIRNADTEQLDEIIERTAYAAHGVAIGDAARDQDLHRAAVRELDRRSGRDQW